MAEIAGADIEWASCVSIQFDDGWTRVLMEQ